MATIKTTGTGSGLRVLTKTAGGVQRVSCSCCEAVCCMYPADQLGVDFTNDDLPDNLTVNGSSLSRAGSTYGNITNGVIFESGVWALYTDGNRSTSNCLILGDGNFTAGDNSVEDQFAASYQVEFSSAVPEVPLTQTFVRTGLCVWTSTFGKEWVGVMRYDTLEYAGMPIEPFEEKNKWVIRATNAQATYLLKSDQNDPVGAYISPNPALTATVS